MLNVLLVPLVTLTVPLGDMEPPIPADAVMLWEGTGTGDVVEVTGAVGEVVLVEVVTAVGNPVLKSAEARMVAEFPVLYTICTSLGI